MTTRHLDMNVRPINDARPADGGFCASICTVEAKGAEEVRAGSSRLPRRSVGGWQRKIRRQAEWTGSL